MLFIKDGVSIVFEGGNEEFGLNWYDYGARNYQADLGRFHTIDPRAEDYGFQSPFAYAANNPIIYVDKNGEGPLLAIAGVIGGALFEAGSQVLGAMATGQSFGDAVSNIDYADVGIAALEYGAAGLTNGTSLIVSGKVSDVLQAAVDMKGDFKVNTVFGGFNGGQSKDLLDAGTELVVGKVLGSAVKKTGDAINNTVINASSDLVAKGKNLKKAINSVKNSNTRSKAKLPNQAFKEFSVSKETAIIANAVKPIVKSQKGRAAGDLIKMSTTSLSKKIIINPLNNEEK